MEVGILAAPICRSLHEKSFTTENAEFTELKRKHDVWVAVIEETPAGMPALPRKAVGADQGEVEDVVVAVFKV